MKSLIDIRIGLEQVKGKREQIQYDLDTNEQLLIKADKEVDSWEKAQVVLQKTVQETQNTLRYRIGEVGSLALEAIFDDPYSLDIDFVLRRGKTEADIIFKRDGSEFKDALNEIGGGSCDSGALGLIFSMWSIRVPRTRPLLLIDEPFRNLDRYEELKRAKRASKLIKQISKEMGLQIIMVTHNTDMIDAADKVIDLGKS